MRRRVWTVLLAAVLTGVLCGDATPPNPSDHRDSAAGTAVEALTDARRGEFALPADFGDVMGYRPVREHGAWVTPTGACSAPTGATRYDFSGPCKAHDLGYDLLRYAARVGEPLGPWAREAIDAAFGRALEARCRAVSGAAGCWTAAAVYHGVVVANSWRQGWRAPRPEPWLPWVLIATALTLAPVAVNAVIVFLARVSQRRVG